MSDFLVTETPLAGLKVVQRQTRADARGSLSRLFCAESLAHAGWHKPTAQINHTYTRYRGTVRGMHLQNQPHCEMKLVSCLAGEIFDVAVDCREGSPTFLQWHGVYLTAANACAFLIPEGFAHGFQAMTDDVCLLYCHSASYATSSERGFHSQDPRLSIAWPLPAIGLSARDASHDLIDHNFKGVLL